MCEKGHSFESNPETHLQTVFVHEVSSLKLTNQFFVPVCGFSSWPGPCQGLAHPVRVISFITAHSLHIILTYSTPTLFGVAVFDTHAQCLSSCQWKCREQSQKDAPQMWAHMCFVNNVKSSTAEDELQMRNAINKIHVFLCGSGMFACFMVMGFEDWGADVRWSSTGQCFGSSVVHFTESSLLCEQIDVTPCRCVPECVSASLYVFGCGCVKYPNCDSLISVDLDLPTLFVSHTKATGTHLSPFTLLFYSHALDFPF